MWQNLFDQPYEERVTSATDVLVCSVLLGKLHPLFDVPYNDCGLPAQARDSNKAPRKTSPSRLEFDSLPVLLWGGCKCGDRQVSGTLMIAMSG